MNCDCGRRAQARLTIRTSQEAMDEAVCNVCLNYNLARKLPPMPWNIQNPDGHSDHAVIAVTTPPELSWHSLYEYARESDMRGVEALQYLKTGEKYIAGKIDDDTE